MSATGLFGDNLQEQCKQLDTSRQIKMTNKMDFFRTREGEQQIQSVCPSPSVYIEPSRLSNHKWDGEKLFREEKFRTEILKLRQEFAKERSCSTEKTLTLDWSISSEDLPGQSRSCTHSTNLDDTGLAGSLTPLAKSAELLSSVVAEDTSTPAQAESETPP